MKILVIEDNPLNMKLITDLLKMSGYDVLQATDGETGIKIAREETPPLVLMDIQLPGMDGLTATRLLKKDEKTSHIKVIALTALAMKGDKNLILEAGCDGYISKPIRYKEALEAIGSFVKEIKDGE